MTNDQLSRTSPYGADAIVDFLELPDFPPVVVGASWSGQLPNISKQLLAELETEAQAQIRRMKGRATH